MEYLYGPSGGRCSYAKSLPVDALEICLTQGGSVIFPELDLWLPLGVAVGGCLPLAFSLVLTLETV